MDADTQAQPTLCNARLIMPHQYRRRHKTSNQEIMRTSGPRLNSVRCATALTVFGWTNNCVIEFDTSGRIQSLREDSEADVDLNLKGTVIAGIPNLHSHAHQKVMPLFSDSK